MTQNTPQRQNAQAVLDDLPEVPARSLLPEIRDKLAATNRIIVVLDDDPTGTQTVYQTPVLTTWSLDAIRTEFKGNGNLFYILTNSRSMLGSEAADLATVIGKLLRQVSQETGRPVTVVSRSDSTLRGHYPVEVTPLAEAMGIPDAVHVMMPFFLQGGRLTVDDVHYVQDGNDLIPAAETPFAKDATFGFTQSNMLDWVVEKNNGQLSRDQIASVGISELRSKDSAVLTARLTGLPAKSVVVVNAVCMRDVESFVMAAMSAQDAGAQFIYRTAASFVQSAAGLEEKPLLQPADMIDPQSQAGLIVVGSYVPKSTTQLARLLDANTDIESVTVDVNEVLGEHCDQHLSKISTVVNQHLESGKNVVLHTSRTLVTGEDGEASLRIGNTVSHAIIKVVLSIKHPLRFLIAKGGITSSDVATKALAIKRAIVLGQILPGVPVWQAQDDSTNRKFPFIVFPGNVGTEDSLLQAFEKLR